MHDNGSQGWAGTVQIPFPLAKKPRRSGITMVIDKGLGPNALADLLYMAGEHIDFIKLGFGTSLLYPPDAIEAKLELARRHGVQMYPGGTLLEVAELQHAAEALLEQACALGFTAVEVSEGTIPLTAARRQALIRTARALGLRVISEVGKKAKGSKPAPQLVHEQVASDLEAGADYVIIEGRDSGQAVGIYDAAGKIDETLVEQILAGVEDPSVLIWEAPQVAQQQQLILKLGNQVNLGNIQPEDAVTLAATRAGLRGDTFRLCVEQALKTTS